MGRLRFGALALAVAFALVGCGRAAADVGVDRLPAGQRPMAHAAVDFFQGLEHKDAKQFCRAIVARVGKRFVRIDPKGCAADFKQGGFDGALDGQSLKRVLAVAVHNHRASVRLVLRVKGQDLRAVQGVVFAFGRWRVPVPAPS
jgi:hypothetical protein